jgi:histidinol-phosphate aminotransferase
VNRYPDDSGAALREQLAARYGVTPEQVLLGNGSVELCRMALAATCDPGDEVIFGQPSFEAYPVLAMQVGATMVQVPLTAAHRYDLDAMADAVTDRTRVVFVCNPNNPTGTIVDRAVVDRFLERVPSDLLVVFDEAYREFVTTRVPHGLEYLERRDNVCVLAPSPKPGSILAWRLSPVHPRSA